MIKGMMPRIVKEEEYAERRNQILDTALRLVYTKGYGQMTIQDILDEIGISKGAFYHYFDSKGAVLEALVERMAAEIIPVITSIVEDPELPALEKLQRYIDTAGRWKTDRKNFLIEVVRVWYADENAIVRQKSFATMMKRLKPLLTRIIEQGVREGSFTTPFPEHVWQMNIYLIQGLGDEFAAMLLADPPEPGALQHIENMIAAYNDAMEQILGAPRGSIRLMDPELLKEWFDSPNDQPPISEQALAKEIDILEPQKA
jgi:AcrR family transcriptional regulator